MKLIKSKSILLRTVDNGFLGQIVITNDGMFASVTDWGNLSFAWRHTGEDDFRAFLCGLNTDYFGKKMYQGNTYILYSQKCEKACQRFAEKILPALQDALKQDIKNDPNWHTT